LYRARVFTVVFAASLWASAAMADGMAYDLRGVTVPQTIPNFGTDPMQQAFRPAPAPLAPMPDAPLTAEEMTANQPKLLPLPQAQSFSASPAPMTLQQVAVLPDEDTYFSMRGDDTRYQPLQDVRVALDMENVTIRQAVDSIIGSAAPKAGPWKVRWQLAEENRYLLDEPMHITAETTVDEFLAFLTEKVVNMSGVKLNTKVFNIGRVIVISDTY
jgi:hypothetical protein